MSVIAYTRFCVQLGYSICLVLLDSGRGHRLEWEIKFESNPPDCLQTLSRRLIQNLNNNLKEK